MKLRFIEYLHDSFQNLVDKYGFSKTNEINDESSYSVEYRSNTLVIKIEKYRREFYVTLYKTGNADKEINLFNLLSYLKRDSLNVPVSAYFEEEKDINECYRKQLNYLSAIIYDNFILIDDFFRSENYKSKMEDIKKGMLEKYPWLFKRD